MFARNVTSVARWIDRRWTSTMVMLLVLPMLTISASCQGTQTTGTATPTGGGTMITAPIQIQSVDILVAESSPPQITAKVTGTIPDSCTTAREPEISRNGSTFTVSIIGERPSDMVCAQVISTYTRSIPLGPVQPGDYTVVVNSLTKQFTVN